MMTIKQRPIEQKEVKPVSTRLKIKLFTGERLYCANKLTGALIECNDKIIFSNGCQFIAQEPDMFYFGALNLVNARFRLQKHIDDANYTAQLEEDKLKLQSERV